MESFDSILPSNFQFLPYTAVPVVVYWYTRLESLFGFHLVPPCSLAFAKKVRWPRWPPAAANAAHGVRNGQCFSLRERERVKRHSSFIYMGGIIAQSLQKWRKTLRCTLSLRWRASTAAISKEATISLRTYY